MVAIRVDEATIASHQDEVTTARTISCEEAEAIDWFDGPSYCVLEATFDEDDLEVCS